MKISTREKRFLIGGGIIALAVLVYYLAPALMPQDLEVQVRQKTNQLRQEREIIGMEDTFKTRLAQAEQRLKMDQDRLLPGDNAAGAGAYMQKVLQEMADASQVEISRHQSLQDQKQDLLTKVSVGLDISCTIDQLVRFLTAIENHDKFLKVENLTILNRRLRNRDEISTPGLRVIGYILTPTPAQKPAGNAAGGN